MTDIFSYESKLKRVVGVVLVLTTITSIPFFALGLWVLPLVLWEFSAASYWKLFLDPASLSIGEQTPYALPFGLYGTFTLWFLQIKGRVNKPVSQCMFVYIGLASGIFSAQHMIRYLWVEWSPILGFSVIGLTACGFYHIIVLLGSRYTTSHTAQRHR